MGDSVLLSELCKICNNKPPKYCCPRCRCLTCSLPCYKRHQTWSQCSGKRDPAAYVKRSQLATPAGIDRDYNFLTGIERAYDQIDRSATRRGISLDDSAGYRKPASARLARRIQDTGVTIHKAPKGMSRQKQNSTQVDRVDGEDCILWTIEWVLPDKSRSVRNIGDFHSYRDAYQYICGQRASIKDKKRKHTPELIGLPEVPPPASPESNKNLGDQAGPSLEDGNSKETIASGTIDIQSNSNVAAEPFFYLFRPLTTGSEVVLVPLSPTETIRHSLKNRVVLEFPTIYVMPESSLDLPQGFQLENDYIIKTRNLVKEIDEQLAPILDKVENKSDRATAAASNSADSVFEESRVMESLQRDLAAARGS